jgi:DNA adenine methylase Dam
VKSCGDFFLEYEKILHFEEFKNFLINRKFNMPMKSESPKYKSPLNYTGNKYRILPQILPHVPKNIDTMVDLFCGGATVGINVPCKNVKFVDGNPRVIGLLRYLASCDFNQLLHVLENFIEHYHLSYSAQNTYAYYKNLTQDKNYNNGLKEYNKEGFYQLRADYNSILDKDSEIANQMLYLLMVYAFNNDIRFSRCGHFNLPVGKTDLNKQNINKLKDYISRVQQINAEFICSDFRSQCVTELIELADFVYMDPPYLITDAVYNESGQWGVQQEEELLEIINNMLSINKPFMLSNVLCKEGSSNEPLMNWVREHFKEIKVIDIDYHYKGASYNKKNRNANEREIIIIPKKRV